MNLLVLIALSVLAGWIASLLRKNNQVAARVPVLIKNQKRGQR